MAKPEIRLKGFEGEWCSASLGSLGKTISGIGFPEKEQGGSVGVPFFKVSDMNNEDNEQVMCTSNNYVTQEQIKRNGWHVCEKPSIFFAKVGAAVLLNRKRLVLSPCLCDNNTMLFCYDEKKWDPYFCLSLFSNVNLASLAQTGSLPSYNGSMVEDITVNIPENIKEQKIIADYFKSLDTMIQGVTKKITSLKQMKQACLVSMFPQEGETTPRVRFKGFKGEWEKHALADIAKFSKGSGYSKNDLCDSGTPIILYGRLYTRYNTQIDNVDTFAIQKPNSVLSEGNEIIVPASGETPEDIACAAVVNQQGVILGGDLNVIRLDKDFDSYFTSLVITYGDVHYELAKYAQGKSVVHLHNSDICKASISYPSLKEQQQIASFFRSMDSQISLQEQRLEKLKQIKSACLDKMFV